jgi:uncharacterized protein YodC (DUF2158 family)
MATSFKVGDVVRLISGGFWMTVEGFDDEAGNIVRCKWFEGKNRHEQPFAKELIMAHPATERPALI